MHLIALSQDKMILTHGKTRDRMISYGGIVEKLTIVLFGAGVSREERIAPTVVIVAPGGGNKLSAFIRGVQALYRIAADERGLLTAQDPFFLGLVAIMVGRMAHTPVQIQVHTDCFSKAYRSESPLRLFQSLLASFVLRRAACVRAVSLRVAERIRSVSAVPVSILPIRVSFDPTPIPRPSEFRDVFTALAVSRLSHEKQLHTLIGAVALTHDIDLVILGDGSLKERLESNIQRSGLDERVRFAGRKENTAAYYQHADAFVQCSRYEGYGMTLVEAALSGLPIITTDVGVVGDILRKDDEALVVAADPRAFADALMRLKGDTAFAHTLGVRAKSRAESFQESEAEYLAKYKDALSSCVF
ncbi:MAG TPA: glycosyltransferase [Candidatus Paceibacterota bacterium]